MTNLLGLLISLWMCDPSPTALGAAIDRLMAADNARHLDAVLAGYTDDVVLLPPEGEPLSGKDAIRPRYENLFASFEIDLSSEIVEARGDAGLGFVRGFTRGTLTPLGGGEAVRVDDKFLAIVRCEASDWRVSRLMWSPRGTREP